MTKPISYDSLYQGVELHVLVSVAKTGKVPPTVPPAIITRMSEEDDMITQYASHQTKWGLRPKGCKLLADAAKHLTDALLSNYR